MGKSVFAWEVDGSAICVLNEEKALDSYVRGLVKIMESPDGEEPVAKIGGYWFYIGTGDWADYLLMKSKQQIASDIIESLEELGETERSYYIFVLEEAAPSPVFHIPVVDRNGAKATVPVKGMFKNEKEAASWAAENLDGIVIPEDDKE